MNYVVDVMIFALDIVSVLGLHPILPYLRQSNRSVSLVSPSSCSSSLQQALNARVSGSGDR